jgi:hypothetical protein
VRWLLPLNTVDEDTFTLLGAELGFVIQIVSPEDEDREILEEFDINLEKELAELIQRIWLCARQLSP